MDVMMRVRWQEWTGTAWLERLSEPLDEDAAGAAYRSISTGGSYATRNVTLVPDVPPGNAY